MDEIFHADDVLVTKSFADDVVVGQSDSLLVDFTKTTFVDEFGGGLESRSAVSDVGLDATEHGHGSVVDFEEDTVVKLTETEKLEDFLGLGVHSHDTSDADNKDDLGGGCNVEVTVVLGLTLHADGGTLGVPVFFDVLFGTFELVSTDAFFGLPRQKTYV